MKFLLDENFPLRLRENLRSRGIDCEHIIASGQRGMSDPEIIERLRTEEDLVLLTQDADFEDLQLRGVRVIISRVPQALPIGRRLELWNLALKRFIEEAPQGECFEILPFGELRPLPQ